MTQTIRTTQGDREPIVAQLSKYGRAVDLTGRSVTFVLRHESGDKAVDAPAEILNETDGRVQYVVTPTDIARAGSYSFEWVVTGGANDPTTLPVDEPSRLHVREDVEQDDAVFEALPEDRTVSTLTADDVLLTDAAADPAQAGEFQRNGTDVKVFTGGGVLNLSELSADTVLTVEQVQDIVGTFITGSGATSVTYDDTNNQLTIAATDTDTQLSNAEVVTAVQGASPLDIDITGDADTVDGYDIQKNGADGTGVVNFKTQ